MVSFGRRRKHSAENALMLLEKYAAALEVYKAEADKLCDMLRSYGDRTSTLLELTLQRDREIEVHAEYHRLRKRLLHLLQLSSARN